MSLSNPTQTGILQRRQQVAELYIQGWTQVAIAAKLAISQTTICHDLAKLRAEWRASAQRDFDLLRAEELQKIDRLEREAWAAWERSQKPSQIAVVSGEAGSQKTRRSVRNQHGDPRFLEQINKCIASRRALLGLDAPTRIEPVLPVAMQLSPEQRRAHIEAVLREVLPPGSVDNLLCLEEKPSDDSGAIETSFRAVDGREAAETEPAPATGEAGS
jgi:hypothetical protein